MDTRTSHCQLRERFISYAGTCRIGDGPANASGHAVCYAFGYRHRYANCERVG